MNKITQQWVCAIAAFIGIVAQAQAASSASLQQALTDADVELNLRLRYEDVHWAGLRNSEALTLRTRLSFISADYHGFGLMLEMDDVTAISSVDYRTSGNDPRNLGSAIIADPEGSELNQSYLSYKNSSIALKYGRQRILLDNQRFVGGVGWRQNEQTYDAFSVNNESIENLKLFYAYLYNVNRVFGEANPIGDINNKAIY